MKIMFSTAYPLLTSNKNNGEMARNEDLKGFLPRQKRNNLYKEEQRPDQTR